MVGRSEATRPYVIAYEFLLLGAQAFESRGLLRTKQKLSRCIIELLRSNRHAGFTLSLGFQAQPATRCSRSTATFRSLFQTLFREEGFAAHACNQSRTFAEHGALPWDNPTIFIRGVFHLAIRNDAAPVGGKRFLEELKSYRKLDHKISVVSFLLRIALT